jgi:hypothetical protein
MARLDRLHSVKEIAQIGATIGREFSYSLMRAVVSREETQLRHSLAELEEAGLIFRPPARTTAAPPKPAHQLAQTRPAPPVVHLLGPAAMATGDVCDNRPRLEAFRGNLCLQIVRPALATYACVHLDTW